MELEAGVGIEPTHTAFAEPRLTTWLPRPTRKKLPVFRQGASGFLEFLRQPIRKPPDVQSPMMNTCCTVMLLVKPGLKAFARRMVGPVSLIGLSYNKSDLVGRLPSSV